VLASYHKIKLTVPGIGYLGKVVGISQAWEIILDGAPLFLRAFCRALPIILSGKRGTDLGTASADVLVTYWFQ
jgi:hypothetical protein